MVSYANMAFSHRSTNPPDYISNNSQNVGLFMTVRTPINIALIKYWGKDDEELIIPCNDSISITLDTDTIYTETTVSVRPSDDFISTTANSIRLILDGKEQKITKRIERCIQKLRNIAQKHSTVDFHSNSLLIESSNNFPTAAGLASSASGLSAIVYATWKLFRLENVMSVCRLSSVARLGSGSACRSLLPGFVRWYRGHGDDDSFAATISPPISDMAIAIFVFSQEQKKISSTFGMQQTKKTSAFFHHRIFSIVPHRLEQMQQAIHQQDFPTVFDLTMKDSNSFHACCLDTSPPIFYLNSQSMSLIEAVVNYNEKRGKTCLAYTFDAGPNGFVIGMDEDMKLFIQYVSSNYFDLLPPSFNQGEMGNSKITKEMTGSPRLIMCKMSNEGPITISNNLHST